jgi:hypothetical protein
MPGTADGVADHDPVGDRRAIVSTLGADREQVVAFANEEDRLIADMALEEVSVSETCEGNAPGKVWPFRPSACDPIGALRVDPYRRLGCGGGQEVPGATCAGTDPSGAAEFAARSP